MSLGLRISQLQFSDETKVGVDAADVVVLIGPNNAGKSRALRDIEACLVGAESGQVVADVQAERSGSEDDLVEYMRSSGALSRAEPGQVEHRTLNGVCIALQTARQLWTHSEGLNALGRALMFRADAESRLQLANSVESIDIVTGAAILPLQRLLVDHSAEARLSEATQTAFDTPVHVHRAGGSRLHLHLGTPVNEARLDSPEYLRELKTLPPVAEQGDGMRSFIGLLLALGATPFPLVMIDEPEAFLHPPQARELGRQLARPGAQQRFIATHSADVLLGLLDTMAKITVIRIRRDGDHNIPAVLSRDELDALWSDPYLRYSNILDGLFHRGVVIGEAEGDAQLYAAALDAKLDNEKAANSDLLFTQCGGKQKLPAAISALRPTGVPVAAIADLDVLRDADLLESIVSALGGEWAGMKVDWKILSSAMRSQAPTTPVIGQLKIELDTVLGDSPNARLEEHQVRAIRALTRRTDTWKAARNGGGVSALPRGEATEAAARLLTALRSIGLFVVHVGALEGWARDCGGSGSRFVANALARDVHRTDIELQAFSGAVADFLATAQG